MNKQGLFSSIGNWGTFKRALLLVTLAIFFSSSFLYFTGPGSKIRMFLAETVITTQHRDWAWIFVGSEKRDEMVAAMQRMSDDNAEEKQDLGAVTRRKHEGKLAEVVDIKGDTWVGKKMYVYDPHAIRVVVPHKQGEGERITSMVERTGAIGGVNGGGFSDPEGLGNGFAAIGAIMSGGKLLFTDTGDDVGQHIVGFTKDGTLIIGKYSVNELRKLGVTEAVSFYPRVIANGNPLITKGDGGWGRAPRTAVGQRADGTVIFIVIDGRQAHSVGATLREVQDLLLEEGCINAGFLDGGASSEMVFNNELLTSPSSRYGERRLPTGFLVFENPESIKVDGVWDGLTNIDPGGSYDHPDYIKEQQDKAKKNQNSNNNNNKQNSPTKKPEGSPPSGNNKNSSTESSNQESSTKPTTKSEQSPATESKEQNETQHAPANNNNNEVVPSQTP
ncbi:phosphodiester glycosidase family protein [Paenibacillus sp. N1-5-1-14]|uniref:phosphodiester glycosidase family protein n=1 Tax=Paenibacillus radicibacter TaxID=2972488 RepID=UPI0021590C5C|nr:phosphodiester glycosidase family protein [Paenibacillus radicibacter]MCR8644169.1 phosphodiester glycosidase family protein [Paenibacillus radicibacter]